MINIIDGIHYTSCDFFAMVYGVCCFLSSEEDAKVLREKEEEERALLDLDEDEYEQLPEEKKMEIDMKRMQLYLEKRER